MNTPDLSVNPTPYTSVRDSVSRVEFPNPLSKFVFTRTYPRWREDDARRETYEEAVDRYVGFLQEKRPNVPSYILGEIKQGILDMAVMPSMRAFWSAGPAADRDNTMFYNCSFIPLDSLKSFSELLYILMMGTGVGYSVERQFVGNLPRVAETLDTPPVKYVVQDSTIGWMNAFYDGMVYLFKGQRVEYDYSLVRKAGARLKTKGGRASGPGPLKNLLDFVQETLLAAAGRFLTTLEANDIACMVGEIVMAGGVRRAALISFSDPDDVLMRDSKKFPTCQLCGTTPSNHLEDHLQKVHSISTGEYLDQFPGAYLGFPERRFMANNSAYWEGKPDSQTFWKEWEALKASGSGERGFYQVPPSKRETRRGDCRSNPCGEILLRFSPSTDPWTGEGGGGQFCNLSAAVMRSTDTVESFAKKVRTATWIGVIQSTFTDFPQLRPAWKTHCEEDRLVGCDITGHCDNPRLSENPEAMTYFNQVALEAAAEASSLLDIPMPVAITCGKPSGNSSQMVDCASGFHTRYAPFYIRRVRISGTDPLFHLIRDAGVPVFKDNKYKNTPDEECPTWVVEFPVASPPGAKTRKDETALEQLERYLHVMRTWCSERGHNQSATVYVREEEWQDVGEWLYQNFEEVTGLSFLPYDGGGYSLAPYEEISQEQYKTLLAAFPDIDYDLLRYYETVDQGEGATELACAGGSCEIDFSKKEARDTPPPEGTKFGLNL